MCERERERGQGQRAIRVRVLGTLAVCDNPLFGKGRSEENSSGKEEERRPPPPKRRKSHGSPAVFKRRANRPQTTLPENICRNVTFMPPLSATTARAGTSPSSARSQLGTIPPPRGPLPAPSLLHALSDPRTHHPRRSPFFVLRNFDKRNNKICRQLQQCRGVPVCRCAAEETAGRTYPVNAPNGGHPGRTVLMVLVGRPVPDVCRISFFP